MYIYPSRTAAILGNFGVGHLTIQEAAALIAKCLFCNGDIEIDYEVESVSLHDKKLEEALKEHIAYYEQKLIDAINKGTLKSPLATRDINENLIKEESYVECDDLYNWLDDRGVNLGDLYHHDYIDEICNTLTLIEKTIEKARIKRENPDLARRYEEDKEYDFLTLYRKISELEKELAAHAIEPKEKSLSTRTRETALKLIIGMAVEGYRYSPGAAKNPAVSEIAGDLEKLGIAVSDDTVRKWLNEASELLPQEQEA